MRADPCAAARGELHSARDGLRRADVAPARDVHRGDVLQEPGVVVPVSEGEKNCLNTASTQKACELYERMLVPL